MPTGGTGRTLSTILSPGPSARTAAASDMSKANAKKRDIGDSSRLWPFRGKPKASASQGNATSNIPDPGQCVESISCIIPYAAINETWEPDAQSEGDHVTVCSR